MTEEAIVEVEQLFKIFRKPLTGRRVEAVRGVTFSVRRGEIFGFLGPNGAGKTTTIKMLTGLVFPTRGVQRLFGVPAPCHEVMGKVGFLPENPYIYPHLTPREFVSLCGELNGLHGRRLLSRVETTIDQVGMTSAIDRQVRTLSKGMVQRVGLAAAIVHEPELLILDEPMSGLDPMGRKEVRDLILGERAKGHTVFFSSHVLSDVELLCDRVCILRQGQVVLSGPMHEIMRDDAQRSEVTVSGATGALLEVARRLGRPVQDLGATTVLEVDGLHALNEILRAALDSGAKIESVASKRESLEDVFVRLAI